MSDQIDQFLKDASEVLKGTVAGWIAIMGVSVGPGEMQLIRTPWGRNCIAVAFTNADKPAFVVL